MAVDFEFEVEVGCAGAAGVAGGEDVLAGFDVVAFVDVDGVAVAVDVAQVAVGLDGEPDAAGVAVGGAGAASVPPVGVEVGGAYDGAGGEGVNGGAFGDEDVDGRVVVVRFA